MWVDGRRVQRRRSVGTRRGQGQQVEQIIGGIVAVGQIAHSRQRGQPSSDPAARPHQPASPHHGAQLTLLRIISSRPGRDGARASSRSASTSNADTIGIRNYERPWPSLANYLANDVRAFARVRSRPPIAHQRELGPASMGPPAAERLGQPVGEFLITEPSLLQLISFLAAGRSQRIIELFNLMPAS